MWRQARHKQSKPSEVQPRVPPNNDRNCWKASDSPRIAPVPWAHFTVYMYSTYTTVISVSSRRQNRRVHADLQALAIRIELSSASRMMIDVVMYHDLWCPSSNPQTLTLSVDLSHLQQLRYALVASSSEVGDGGSIDPHKPPQAVACRSRLHWLLESAPSSHPCSLAILE
jgi:hypothetical protein